MSERLRVFVPFGGKVCEIEDYEFALKLADAARKERKPMPIAVKTVGVNSVVKIWAVMEHKGQPPAIYRPFIAIVTTQARRVAEAAIWVQMVQAFIALGVFAQYAGALTITREGQTDVARSWRPSMAPDNPLFKMAQPVDFDAYFAPERETVHVLVDDEPEEQPS